MKLRWRYGLVAGVFLAIFSLYPQMKMAYLRGDEWNGNYAYNDIDEVAYASYIRALIDGRPRKNDPYTGKDHSVEAPQDESLFSIQFAAPLTVALPARLLGVGAPWAMTIAGALAAFLTALAVFWLIGMVTGNSIFAMAGSLIVLAGGAVFAGEGALGEITGWSYAYPYFPGFRRYIPALAFPAFFLLVGLVWKLLERSTQSAAAILPLAILAFAYTVFSYFYVWTTAAAWLGCLGICLLLFRPEGYVLDLKRLAILGAGSLIALVPYAYLLSQRSHTMDHVQLLVRTRMPDLFRVPELIGYFVILVIMGAAVLRIVSLKDRAVIFTISLALVPLAVFNQQVITGQALQPIHYQVFIGNYVAGLALVLAAGILSFRGEPAQNRLRAAFSIALAVLAAFWGFVECHYTVQVLDYANILRDEAAPVAARLDEIARTDPQALQKTVLHYGIAEGDDLPTLAPQPVLWARHQHVFASEGWQQHKERYYQFLYYNGVSEQQLAASMKRGTDFVSIIALFGWGRHTDRLNSEYEPLSFGEIDIEARKYGEYAAAFDARRPGVPKLYYAIVPTDENPSLSNLDRWYERNAGEVYGGYVLYELRLRE
jgi:hypothetical protein